MSLTKVLLIAIISLSGLWGCSKYPFTAEQSGAVSLGLEGKKIGYALMIFREEHDRWPQSLSELVESGLVTGKDLLYPKTCNLVDRRDLVEIAEWTEWIYLRPRDGGSEMPLLMAPLPYTSLMGKHLREPKRIILKRDLTVEWRDEHEISTIIRTLAGT